MSEYESYILIEFYEASDVFRNLFNDLSDIDSLLFQLQFHYHKQLTPRKSVIISDEVQECPKAQQAIKKTCQGWAIWLYWERVFYFY